MYKGLDQETILAAKALVREAAKEEIFNLYVEYAQKIDSEIELEEGDTFSSDTFNRVAYLGLDEFFYKYDDEDYHNIIMKEMGYIIDISLQTYAFLHELGHIITIDKYDNWLDVSNEYYRMNFAIVNSKMDRLSQLRAYKKLPLELDADEWAYRHYQENKDAVMELDRKIWEIANRD